MSYIGQAALKNSELKRFDITSSTSATHVLSWTAPNEQSLFITINGIKQQDDAYSIAGSPTTVTLTNALVATDKMEVIGIVDIGVLTIAADNTVSTSALGDTSVTTAKLADSSVTSDKILNATISGADIAGLTIGAEHIEDNAITLAKMAGLVRGKIIVGDASGDPSALTVGSADQVLTSDGTDASWAAAGGGGPARNLIMNGNFNIWQRGTGFSTVAHQQYTADRWVYEKSGAMVHYIGREANYPTQAESGLKSNYSIQIDCTTADASLAAGDYCNIVQRIEGFNFAQLVGNTATMSFWVRATKTGIYCMSVQIAGSDRSYITEYTVNTTNTWEKKTASILFNYSGGINNYLQGVGLQVKWALATGSTYQGTKDTWNSANVWATSNQVNACDDAANNFNLSQVQFEMGSSASTFETILFPKELASCQRYYEKSYGINVTPGATSDKNGTYRPRHPNSGTNGTNIWFKVTKRAVPTIVFYAAVSGNTGKITNMSGGASDINCATESYVGESEVVANYTSTGGETNVEGHWTAEAEL